VFNTVVLPGGRDQGVLFGSQVGSDPANVERYLINHLISMISKRTKICLSFCPGTEQPHQGDMNTNVAIPNTTKEVLRYQIRLDPVKGTTFFWLWRQ
jgi:hypothetical protein